MQRAAHRPSERRRVRVERLVLGEVGAAAPRDHLVGEPLPGSGEVAVEQARAGGLQLGEQRLVPHGT